MPGAVVRKPILEVKSNRQELRKDWLGVLSPFVDLEEKAKVDSLH